MDITSLVRREPEPGQPENVYAHVDQPAYEQMQIDHSISRVAIFFVCFLTLGVFYFTLVNFPIAKMLPFQQLEQVGQVIGSLNPAASHVPAVSAKPTGLGGSQIGPSAIPSTSAAPAASAASSASAKPSASAAALSGNTYTVQTGDTLTTIARQFNISAQSIAEANKMTANATLHVGQKLTIPR